MSAHEQDLVRRQQELAELRRKIIGLAQRRDRIRSDLRHDYQYELNQLQGMLIQAQAALDELQRKHNKQPAPDREAETAHFYADMELAVKRAMSRFGSPD